MVTIIKITDKIMATMVKAKLTENRITITVKVLEKIKMEKVTMAIKKMVKVMTEKTLKTTTIRND